ncbi:hypothetical protein BH20VER2_BH20VER2_00100 [soil metagenome]|nr:DinB family protein [Chthoniobacterales bacterium]
MKTSFLPLLVVAAFAATCLGQTTPAEESKTITKDERDRAIAYLKETQQEFVTAVDGLTEAQWKFKASPERWSIAETAEHIALTEDRIWKMVNGKMMKSPPTPEKRAEAAGKDEMILKAIPDRSTKVQAPEQLQPTGKWETPAAIVQDFQKTRAQEISYLAETQEDLRSHFEEHPLLKTMDAYQWLLLNGAHGKRHTAQIIEVKADPNFPKS